MTTTDRIETELMLQAPLERVWHALADADTFGRWFGADLRGQRFVAGQRARGPITHPGYEHVTLDVLIEAVEPQRLLSFRWHPHAIDPQIDYSGEPTTLVTFTLSPAGDGTLLRVVEAGFDALPPERRALAFRMNHNGWLQQMRNIARHVEQSVASA